LKMTFEDQLKALIFCHLEEHTSSRHLLQVLEEDDFARGVIAAEEGIKKSSFDEAINTRGLEQLTHIYHNLQTQAVNILPKEHERLGLITEKGQGASHQDTERDPHCQQPYSQSKF